MDKYKKADKFAGKYLSLQVGSSSKIIGDRDILEGSKWEPFAKMGMLQKIQEEEKKEQPAPSKSVEKRVAAQKKTGGKKAKTEESKEIKIDLKAEAKAASKAKAKTKAKEEVKEEVKDMNGTKSGDAVSRLAKGMRRRKPKKASQEN